MGIGTIILIIILVILVLALLWIYLISFKMSKTLSEPELKSYEFTLRRSREEEHSYGDFAAYKSEPFQVTMRDGYVIHGEIFPLDPKKVVIISHGHGDNKYTGIRFLQTFRNLGYTTVIYDLRGHGEENASHICTMGLNESKDLIEVLEEIRKRYPKAQIGLHGLSMGCATTVNALQYKPDVDFVIADCGYGILKDVCTDELKKVKAPKWMFYPVDHYNKRHYGYSAKSVNPIDALVDNEIPILFIHGTDDETISFHQSEWMHDLNKGEMKEIYLVPGVAHAKAWDHDPAEYERVIAEFLQKIEAVPENNERRPRFRKTA